jgi:cytochrome b involved in lipid metabolism
MRARVPTPRAQQSKDLPDQESQNYPKPNKLRNFYTPKDVREHNTHDDCWVSLFNKVYDLTKLLHENNGKCECDPIVLAAGTDVTHWFDPKTQAVSLKMQRPAHPPS